VGLVRGPGGSAFEWDKLALGGKRGGSENFSAGETLRGVEKTRLKGEKSSGFSEKESLTAGIDENSVPGEKGE